MSPSRWISTTNAKGFVSKRGKYDGGTFAHPDIALEFASWIDPAFKLYLIQEFEKYRVVQDRLFESDFDKFLLDMKKEDCIK